MMLGMKLILIHILKQTFMLVFCMTDQGFVRLYAGRDEISVQIFMAYVWLKGIVHPKI